MSKRTSEEPLITRVEKFLKERRYAVSCRIEVHELEIYQRNPPEKEPGVIDFTQAEFLAVLSVSDTSKWKLIYQDSSNKDEFFKLAGELCKLFEVHVLISLDLKKVSN